ncbi:MAG: TetR/AcrR family transcriptional regulator [Bacteroidota bacterium]
MTRKNEILKVSAALIREKGYVGVSMRDLAKAIGVKAASLYNHIPSKQAILEELILDLAEDFTSQIKSVSNSQNSSQAQLKKIIAHHVDLSLHEPDKLAVLNHEWIHLEGRAMQDFKSMRNQYEEEFRKIINVGIAKKELKLLHTELVLFSLLSTLRNLNLWIKKRGALEPNQLKLELTEALLKGIS